MKLKKLLTLVMRDLLKYRNYAITNYEKLSKVIIYFKIIKEL